MRRTIALLSLCLAPLAGCGSIPETHYYVLAAPATTPAGGPAKGTLRIGVDTLFADPPYDQDQLVYRIGRDGTEVNFYDYHRWAVPPGRLLQAALSDALDGLGGASFEPTTLTGDYAAHLGGRVVVIEEVDHGGGEIARLRLVLRLRSGDGEILWQTETGAEAGGQAESVGEIVEQMRAALGQVVLEIRDELGDVVGELGKRP